MSLSLTQLARRVKTVLEVVFYSLWILLIFSIFFPQSFEWSLVSGWAGKVAIFLLWVIALPGILKRFKSKGVLQKVQTFLMIIRRQMGILMFVLALSHYFWGRVLIYIQYGFPQPGSIPVFETFGFLTLAILTPLFLTSNDWSVRFFKKNWHRIHALIYVAMWLIAVHVSMQSFNHFVLYGIPTFVIAFLQLASWVNVWVSIPAKVKS